MSRAVYVAKSEPGPVKVGISNNPRHRLASIRTGSAVGISLAYAGACECPGAAELIEKPAHKLLRDHHKRGEWFGCEVETAIAAVMQAATDLGYEIQPLSLEKKRPGRPKTGRFCGNHVLGVRMPPELRQRIVTWGKAQSRPLNLSEAMRSLLEMELAKRAGHG